MKATASRVLIAFCLVALCLVGVDWVLETSEVTLWIFGPGGEWQGMRSLAGGMLSLWVGVALLLLPLLAASAWLLVGRDDSIKARAKDGDMIRLRPEAVERSVARAVKEKCEEVIKVRAEARQGRGLSPFVRVHVAVVDSIPVPQARTNVRKAAVEVLDHLLGVSDATQVHVVVHDITNAGGGERPARKRRPEGDKPRRRPEGPRKPAPKAIAADKDPE